MTIPGFAVAPTSGAIITEVHLEDEWLENFKSIIITWGGITSVRQMCNWFMQHYYTWTDSVSRRVSKSAFFLGVIVRGEVDKERLWDRPEEAPEWPKPLCCDSIMEISAFLHSQKSSTIWLFIFTFRGEQLVSPQNTLKWLRQCIGIVFLSCQTLATWNGIYFASTLILMELYTDRLSEINVFVRWAFFPFLRLAFYTTLWTVQSN